LVEREERNKMIFMWLEQLRLNENKSSGETKKVNGINKKGFNDFDDARHQILTMCIITRQ